MKTKPDFLAFSSVSKAEPRSTHATKHLSHVQYLQVRLLRTDAIRLRRVAEERGQSIQSALVDAVNLYLREEGEPPAPDPGTGSAKQS